MEDSTSDLLEDCKNLNTSELPPLVLIDGEMLNWDMSKAQLVQTSQEDIESPSTSLKEEPEELQQCSKNEKQPDVQVVVPNFEMLNKPPDSRVKRQKTLHLENSNSGLRAEIGRLKLELRALRAEVARHMTLCHSGEIESQEWQDLITKLETSNDL
uniref:Uncharacterized protein n=1 Tax=Branchiostoma floridae TaxID=7739 RepID=C3Z1E6_BRAFL|eukprot:XP_002597552.1 hypothetical protein BRAFLDRAFT_78895 [Branchiostoma floridae]